MARNGLETKNINKVRLPLPYSKEEFYEAFYCKYPDSPNVKLETFFKCNENTPITCQFSYHISALLNSNGLINIIGGYQMPESILRLPEVQARTGLSRSTIYARVGDKTFPKPISLGERAIGFVESEVEGWIQSRIIKSRGQVENLDAQ